MRNSLITNIIYYNLLVLTLSCTAQKEKANQNINQAVLHSDAIDDYNLKGPVNEVRSFWHDLYDKDTLSGKQDYANIVGWFAGGYMHFDKEGRINKRISTLDSINQPIQDTVSSLMRHNTTLQYFLKEYNKKSELAKGGRNPFPVRNPNNLQISYYRKNLSRIKEDSLDYASYYFIYDLDSLGKILQERRYLVLARDTTGLTDENIELRSKYSYNKKDLVVTKELFMREHLKMRLFEDMYFEKGLLISINAKLRYTYDYDEKNRLTKVTLLKNDKPIFFEEYTYNDQGQPIEVYIYHSGIYTVNVSTFSRRKLDIYGNTIEEIGLTPKGEVMKIRYYEYQYDEKGNWIQCDLYLDGKTPRPTKICKRIITYYE